MSSFASTPAPSELSSQGWPYYNGKKGFPQGSQRGEPETWIQVETGTFSVRGPNYLYDRMKEPSKSAAFQTVSCTGIDSDIPLYHVSGRLRQLREYLEAHKDEEFFVSNRAIPIQGGTRNRNVIVVAKRVLPVGEDPVFDRVWDAYKKGDNEYKDLRMKLIPGLANAPWLLKKSVEILGGQRPVIMGKGYLKQEHYVGSNYVEVDTDINSSIIAKKIAGKILPVAASLQLDVFEAFVIEGKTEEELPERILEEHSFFALDTDEASVDLIPEDYEEESIEIYKKKEGEVK
mmetsp:Transcript_16297/g.33541  ORF Transcript_16297/g.33541 Transcript_16297/m.33541 type:complete len:289 (+) Transcript_16297:206-1072(+)